MTTLSTFTINGTSVLGTIINFEIQKKLYYPFNFKGKFAMAALDRLKTPTINHQIIIQYTDSIGAYDIYRGRVTKVTDDGKFYTIEATSDLIKLFNHYTSYEWAAATNHNDIMEDLCDATAGPGFTVIDSVSNPQSISYYRVVNGSVIDELRKLALFSADGAGDKLTVVRSGASDFNSVIIEDYGENVPATDISLSHTNGALLSRVAFDDTSQEIVNKVVMDCLHNVETRLITDVDAGSGSIASYGTRILKTYRPEIRTQTDARISTDTILRQYSEKRDRFKVDVKHSALHGNSTHYPVVNTLYTVVDAITGTTYTDKVCIEQTLRYPSFRDTLTFGNFYINAGDYFLSQEGNSNYVEASAAPKSFEFRAYRSMNQTIEAGAGEAAVFDTEAIDLIGGYDPTTGIYTVVVPGMYLFSWSCALLTIPDTASVTTSIYRGSAKMHTTSTQNLTGAAAQTTSSGSWSGYVASGDALKIMVSHNDASLHNMTAGETSSYFSGRKV